MISFKDKILLITGGTGSFGNAVLRRFLTTDIAEIRILSRDEKKQDDMRHTYQELYPQHAEKIKFYIGDVRDYNSILNAFRGVDYVFHAAALKQVPSCEFYPMEAVKTNVAGSDNVISACVANHVKKAIFLSTDKAAYPINAMGMTKAVMEKNVIARSRQMLPGDPVLCLTRYGNVMASRGSVIPLFCDRIDEGKPLTITNPNTPHFHPGYFGDNYGKVNAAFERLSSYVQKTYPDMALYLGNELRYEPECVTWLRQVVCRTVNGTRYVLVDFSETAPEKTIGNGLHNLLNAGYSYTRNPSSGILLPPILQAKASEHPHSGTDAYKPPDDPQSQDALES